MIPLDGIHEGIPFADYLAIPAWSASTLNKGRGSMLALYHYRNEGQDQTDALAFGTLAHMRVLEPLRAADRFVVPPAEVLSKSGSRAGNIYKGWATEQTEAGRRIVTAKEMAQLDAMAARLHAHPVCRKLLEYTTREIALIWTDPTTGAKCKCRLDALSADHWLDYKTVAPRDASAWGPESFGADFFRHGYDLQYAHYSDGVAAVVGPNRAPLCIAQSRNPLNGYDCIPIRIPQSTIERGRQERDRILAAALECERTGAWPGVAEEIGELCVPGWAQKDVELDFEDEEGEQ